MPEEKKVEEIDLLEGLNVKTVNIQKQEKPKTKAVTLKDDTYLTILTKDGLVSKTLTECSDEEFLTWIKNVYPSVTAPASNFSSKQARMNAFATILKYHEKFLTLEQRETIH